MDISEVARMLIEKKGLKQVDIVKATGIPRSTISRAIQGDYKGIKYINEVLTVLYPELTAKELIDAMELVDTLRKKD